MTIEILKCCAGCLDKAVWSLTAKNNQDEVFYACDDCAKEAMDWSENPVILLRRIE